VKAPILILHGMADRLIPPTDSEDLAARGQPGVVTRRLYPDIGHVVGYDKGPDIDVPAFLASLKTPR
jgi:pimeloyl-ACP methyl ester carboxylesterase